MLSVVIHSKYNGIVQILQRLTTDVDNKWIVWKMGSEVVLETV